VRVLRAATWKVFTASTSPLGKPFTAEVLAAKVRQMIDQTIPRP
jgi:hypothetical protein